MSGLPQVPPSGELAALRARVAELEAQGARDVQLGAAQARLAVLAEQIEELRRRLGKDSSTSSKPPSSDSPYAKKPQDRSLRHRSGRSPGKQPGEPSSALRQSDHPDDTVDCWPAACGACGTDLADAVVIEVQRRQVFEAQPAPPQVTEYRVAAKACPGCGAAARLGPFLDRVRELLRDAGVLYADETPARAAGGLRYMHVARTEFVTALHTGGRSAEDIGAGGVLPGYAGTIVRDGYAGYYHLGDALHAWCGTHGLRDLKGLYEFDPQGQVWARSMADLLIWANRQASAARAAGRQRLGDDTLAEIRSWY